MANLSVEEKAQISARCSVRLGEARSRRWRWPPPGEEEEKYAFHSFGAQFCELKVNRWTGEVRLQRITSVMDIGTVVNLKDRAESDYGWNCFRNRDGSFGRLCP